MQSVVPHHLPMHQTVRYRRQKSVQKETVRGVYFENIEPGIGSTRGGRTEIVAVCKALFLCHLVGLEGFCCEADG
jgi:hypothetical protein